MAMSDSFSEELTYLKEHRLNIYFEDCIRSLLDARRRPVPNVQGKFDINIHLRDYFAQVKRESHVLAREFSFINGTPYNRRAFLTHLWSKCETSTPTPSTLKEIHSIMISLCPDFPFSLVENSSTLIEDWDSSANFDYVTFLRAFQVRFIYDEFLDEAQQLFRTFSHRLTCHVPTAEHSVPQPDHDHCQMLFGGFEKLIKTKTCPCPPLNILEEVLLSSEQQLNYQKFLVQLAKNEKLTRFIGKEPSILKQARPVIQQQRSIIEPVLPIQNETKLILTSLSTPTTRISSPIAPAPLLPPLSKQQGLTREKPIRQGSPALAQASLPPRRVESATSFVPPAPGSAKSTNQMTTIIKQEISETDSDVESRSSDTDSGA